MFLLISVYRTSQYSSWCSLTPAASAAVFFFLWNVDWLQKLVPLTQASLFRLKWPVPPLQVPELADWCRLNGTGVLLAITSCSLVCAVVVLMWVPGIFPVDQWMTWWYFGFVKYVCKVLTSLLPVSQCILNFCIWVDVVKLYSFMFPPYKAAIPTFTNCCCI